MRISDWSSDVCSSDLQRQVGQGVPGAEIGAAILLRWDEREPFSGAAAHGLQARLMADTAVARRSGMGLAEQQVAVAIDTADVTVRPIPHGISKNAHTPGLAGRPETTRSDLPPAATG